MNTNLLRRRENENEGYTTHDNSSDSDSDIEINNNCARRKAMSIPSKNVLNTSESEEDHVVDDLRPSSSNDMQWTMENCVVCSKNGVQRQTHYQCNICDVGLCVCPCFKTFHTKLHY
ncbi:hypothetical protein ANTQUA_LOCUS10412 [Anthophora quadrimaculata]